MTKGNQTLAGTVLDFGRAARFDLEGTALFVLVGMASRAAFILSLAA